MKTRIVTSVLSVVPVFLIGIAAGAQAPSPLPSPERTAASRQVAARYGKLPLSFEPNRGQTDPRVQFVSRGAGYTIFLSPTSATFALQRGAGTGRPTVSGQPPSAAESAVVRMDLLGASPDIAIEPQDKLPGIANYLTGSTRTQWPTNLPTYAKTRSPNVYPGIDLIYYGTQGQLEYDFVLTPLADPASIRLRFSGATPVIDGSGDLVLALATHDGQNDIRFHKPVLYQQVEGIRRPVNGKFTVAANHDVGFQVGAYDHSRELVIDPELVYSSYLGGSSQQSVIYGMAINAAGQMYVTGVTNALDYPTTPGVIQANCPASNGAYDTKCGPSSSSAAFVSKISADGQSLIYSTYLGGSGGGYGVGGSAAGAGGSGNDLGTGIAVDANDNAWVVGQTNSNNFPITANAYSLNCEPAEIASGAYIISTKANSCGGPNASGYFYNGTYSLFLVQLNPTGTNMLYGTFLGGTNGELAAQIALDAAGDIYVAGSAYTNVPGTFAQTSYYNYPTTPSAFQTQALTGGAYSAFVTEFAPGGQTILYSTMFGGPNENTYNNALAVGAGKIFIGGFTQDPHLPTTPGAISSTCQGSPTAAGPDTDCVDNSPNGYVAEFDPTKSGAASLVFSTYLNGSVSTQRTESSSVNALAADASGNVYAGGQDSYTVQEGFPTTPGVLQPACLVASNSGECGTGFVTKLSPAGALVWSTFYGSPSTAGGNQTVSAIALDANRNVYIAANASGLGDFPLNNGFQGYAGGVAYVTELKSDASQVLFGSFYGGANNVFPTGMAVDAKGNIYVAGYTAGGLPLDSAYQSTNGGGYNEGFFAKISGPAGPPTLAGAVNAESGSPTIAPNTWVEIGGSNLAKAGDARTWQAADFQSGDMPTQLDGVSVTVNGKPAYIFYISPTQVNILTPPDALPGSVAIELTNNGVTSASISVPAQALSPSFFVFSGTPYVAALHADYSLLGPASLFPGSTTPAKPGETVLLYANGFGATSVPVVSGSEVQSGSLSPLPVVEIGGIGATVDFAGLVAPGEFQFNVTVPASLADGDQPLKATYNGSTTQSATLITVQN